MTAPAMLASAAVLCLACYAAAAVSLGPRSASSPLAVIWLPNGLFLAVLLYLMIVAVPAILLAATIAERGKAEENLRLSEERYREVVESQTDMVCRYRHDTTLTFVNEAFCRCFGRTRDALIGQRFVDLVPLDSSDRLLAEVVALEADGRMLTHEHEMMSPDGPMWQQWTTHAIAGPGATVTEFQAVGRDITDRKRAEEAHRTLAHAQRLAVVGELTASIAHEINQPLNAMFNNAEAAEMLLELEQPRIEEVRQILADIRRQDLMASHVVHRMRTLLARRELAMSGLDLNETIAEALHLISGDALRRRIVLDSELARPLPPVQGDRVHLQQVLLNLAVNGMDAMAGVPDARRRLIVRTTRTDDGFVDVAVSDSGHGIGADRQARLFESFYTTKKDGMGLGLSIARSIVQAHHGRIWAENNAAGGATFHFALPARASECSISTSARP